MNNNLSIYLHWPFCQQKCPYCDFNSYAKEDIDTEIWLNAYISAIDESLSHTGKRNITSIYFGGGTPSLMPPMMVEKILEAISLIHEIPPHVEITLEANPTSFEASRFFNFKSAGINRLSIGVQSFDDKTLKFLGRWHNAHDAITTLNFAQKYFDRFSFDLIYARPEQSLSDWEDELTKALKLAKGHLSLYQLTIEPATPFGRQKQTSLDDDRAALMYLRTMEIMEAKGLAAYEVSNFASSGQESRHNLNYWQGGDWIGIGAGAHGRFFKKSQRIATQDALYPQGWLKKVEQYGHGRQSLSEIPLAEQKTEVIMTGLRTKWGFPISLLSDAQRQKLEPLKEEGLITEEQGQIKASYQGWLLLNSLIAHIL